MTLLKKKILVVGSVAYDHVMQCKGYFKDLLVTGDPNMAITAQNRTISFGGCGGNIAYNLRLFDESPVLMTSVGRDFGEYRQWLQKLEVDVSSVHESTHHLTASAFIVTDPKENQVILFDAGAMNEFPEYQRLKNFGEMDSPKNELSKSLDITQNVKKSINVGTEMSMAIISPDNPDRMLTLADDCFVHGIPYLFDPAQQITHIEPKALEKAVRQARIVVVNEHESRLLRTQLGVEHEDLLRLAPIFIETRGAEGCKVYSRLSTQKPEEVFVVSAVPPTNPVDPTGCGDAFRAGVIAGLQRSFDLKKACQIGALTATYNLEQKGTQQHSFTLHEFGVRFEKSFGVPF